MQTAYMSLGEACERLRIPPRTFRQLMADFGDLIEAPRPSGDGRLMELSVFGVERLQHILQLRNRGITTDAIREQLQAEPAAARAEVAATAEAAVVPQPEVTAIELDPASTDPSSDLREPDTADPSAAQPTLDDPVAEAEPTGNAERSAAEPTASSAEEDILLQRQAELVDTLERLTGELSRSEERRVDERDRLLTTLIRTQREIQQLRYEVAAHLTRKGRKQQGWVARWFG